MASNWRDASGKSNNASAPKINTKAKNWRDVAGVAPTDAESIKIKPYVAEQQNLSMPQANAASFSARKALNSSSMTEGITQPSLNPNLMPNSNTEYWEKGMPRTEANQNKPTNTNVGKAITDLGASVLKGLVTEAGNFPKATGQVLEGANKLANTNKVTKALSSLIPGEFQPIIQNGQAINQAALQPIGDKTRDVGQKFDRQSENNSALWNNTLSTAESFGRMAADIPMSLLSGLPTPAIMGITSADETYNENISKGMNPNEALLRSVISGAIEGGSEYIGGGKDIKNLLMGNWKALIAKEGEAAAENAMKKTLGHKAWEFFKENIVKEAAQEAGTEVAHDVADTVLNGVYNGQWNDGRTLKEDAANVLWAGYGGGLMGGVGGGVGTATRTLINAPGLQAEVVGKTPDSTIIQTETGEQMPVRDIFLQEAKLQDVNVNLAQENQAQNVENQPQLSDDEKINNAIQEIDAAKADHEAGKIKTKDYLNKLAEIDRKLYGEEAQNAQETTNTLKVSQEALQSNKEVRLPNTPKAQNKGISESLRSEEGQAVLNKIKQDMKSQGIDANFEVIKGGTGFHKDIQNVMKSLGVNVVFYKGDKVPNGFISNTVKNTIFIHSSGQRNDMVATTGHEFLHHVKKTYAKEYGELLNFAKAYFTEEAKKQFLNTYSNVPELQHSLANNENNLLEEMLADEMGNNFVDKNFWQKLYDHSRELFEKLVEAAHKIISSISNGHKYDTYIGEETAQTLSKKFEEAIASVRKQVSEGKVDTEARITDNEGVQLKNSARAKEKTEEEKIADEAAKHFGTTTNFNEAGYLTVNGKLLDFSGKKDGGEPGYRSMDHREISDMNDYNGPSMTEFMDMGNIRMKPESDGFELTQKPTETQIRVLKRYINSVNGQVYVDLGQIGKHNSRPEYMEYSKGTKADKVINDIGNFYEQGHVHKSTLANFHTQFSTRSKEFKQWFGDSKVVDEKTGEPLILYHGSKNQFTVFDKNRLGKGTDYGFYGQGFYFTPDKEYAESYSNDFDDRTGETIPGNLVDAYLSIQNPKIFRPGKELDEWEKKRNLLKTVKDVQAWQNSELQDKGYDGVMVYTPRGLSEVVAFEPTQIKSATGNNGEYSKTNPDIRYSTRTKEFKNWFGDSKVTEQDGETPKVVYHGTSKSGFNMFDTYGSNYGLFGQGSYFTEDSNIASQYTDKGKGNAKGIYPVYLRVEYPLDMDKPAKKFMWEDMFPDIDFSGITTNESAYRKVEEWYTNEEWLKWEASQDIIDRIQGAGYDGITHIGGSRVKKSDGTKHRVWITFEPNQVKSAIGNNGNYSNDNPDIRESVRVKERQHAWKQYENSEAMDNEVYKRIPDDIKALPETMSIKGVFEDANARVRKNPQEYINKVRDSESFTTPESVAEAEAVLLLTQQAAQAYDNEGDSARANQKYDLAASIASKIITHFTTASRTLNMGKLWRMLTPEGAVRVAQRMIDKEADSKKKQKVKAEVDSLIKALKDLDNEGLKKIKEALGFDTESDVTPDDLVDEVEYNRGSDFNEVDERVKEVAEVFDEIEKRNAKKIADKVKKSIKSVLEGIDFGIKFMARGLELNPSESINDKIARLTEEYYSKPLAERGNLARILSQELGLPMSQADIVAKRINDAMKEVTREDKIKALKGSDKETTDSKKKTIESWLTPKMKENPTIKSWIDRILELSDSGALTKDDLMPLIAAKYNLKTMTPEIQRNLKKLAENIQKLDKGTDEYNIAVNALNDYMNSITKHDIWEYVNSFENLAMLSGPKSMMRNTIGNLGRLAAYDIEKFGSALFDISRSIISKDKTRKILMPNVKEQVKGIGQGYYKAFRDAWKNVNSRSYDDTREFAKYIKYKNKPMNIFQRYVGLLMTDTPFTQAMINELVSEADKLAKKNGIEFDEAEARQRAEQEANTIFFNGNDKIIDALLKIRRTANLGKQWGIGTVVLKFAKVPYNVSKFAVEREYHLAGFKVLYKAVSTGYGAVTKQDKGYLKDKKFDSKAFIEDISKGLSGALVMYLGTMLYSLGMIRVRPDDDDKDKKLLGLEKLVGFNKYQLNLSAIRRYFVEGTPTVDPQDGDMLATLDWFAPLSILMVAGIKSQMIHEQKAEQPGNRELAWYRKLWDYAVANPAAGIGEGILEQVNTVLEMPMLQSLNKFKYADNWQQGLMEILKDIPARFIPAPVKYAKEFTDNTQRETYTDESTGVGEAINKVKVKLPGVSKQMEPKIDMFGRDLELYQNAKNNFLNIAINPAITTRYQAEPEAKKMLDVYQKYGIKDQIPSAAPKQFDAKKSQYKTLDNDIHIVLTASEYRYYQQEYGKGVKNLLTDFEVVDNKELQQKKANKLNTEYSKLRDKVEAEILKKRGLIE